MNRAHVRVAQSRRRVIEGGAKVAIAEVAQPWQDLEIIAHGRVDGGGDDFDFLKKFKIIFQKIKSPLG